MTNNNKKLCFDVMMIGPRRTGKSSVLASMVSSFDRVSSETFIDITPDTDTKKMLEEKLIKLRTIHSQKRALDKRIFNMDENQTPSSDDYSFNITYKDTDGSKKDLADVRFMDRPGEFLTDNIQADILQEEVGKADVLIIAIDTIHLMEEDSRFFANFHRIPDLHNCISSSDYLRTDSGKKLVMFVPLKCERYYHEGRMEQVKEKLRERCKLLFDYFTAESVQSRVTVTISPILTIGGIEFDSFGRDENNKIRTVVDKTSRQLNRRPDPAYIFYRFYKNNPGFSPKYCEQPVLYMLFYIASLAGNKKKEKSDNIFGRLPALLQLFLLIPFILYDIFSTKNVSKSMQLLKTKIKTKGDGYEIVQNALQI